MTPFAVIIPWRNRPELRQTLAANAALFARHAKEVLVVNCGGDPAEVAEYASGIRHPGLRQVVLPGAAYNWALANNMGALCSSAPRLFFLDADIILESNVFRQVDALLARQDCFVQIRTVRETRPQPEAIGGYLRDTVHIHEMFFQDGRMARLVSGHGTDGSRCGPGLMLMNRRHLLRVGGFNSALKGWGFDDRDVQIRLQLVLNLAVKARGTVLHLTHGDEVRAIRTSAPEDARHNKARCLENYGKGCLQGSYLTDAQTWGTRLRVDSTLSSAVNGAVNSAVNRAAADTSPADMAAVPALV